MKIIKRGKIPSNTKKFTCGNCGTIFEANYGEWHSCGQIAQMHDGLLYECKCPVCERTAYIER